MKSRIRKRISVRAGILACLLAVSSFAQDSAFWIDADSRIPASADFWSDYPSEDLASALSGRMSDEELLAQIFMFGWAGKEPSAQLVEWVERCGLGSVKVFGWNTEDKNLVAQSVTALQQKSQSRRLKIPLFVATDQEGGFVRHVKDDTSVTPGNLALGAGGTAHDAYYSGYYINREIAALGINMNFAPTVDLLTARRSAAISSRSFGDNPEHAGILGAAFAAGSLAAGVIPTAKHFPGHGDTPLDSHGILPVIGIDAGTWERRELVPFQMLIKSRVPAIMSAHLSFPQIDPTGAPASISYKFLTEILRDRLGYEGLIITDDMQMVGVTEYAGAESVAYRMAIEAGNDIIISSRCASLNSALWTRNLALMREDPGFREQVRTAARRVILCKLRYFKEMPHVGLYPDKSKIRERIPDPEGQKFFLEQACRSITAGQGAKIPLSAADSSKILLVGQFSDFFAEGKKRYPNARQLRFNYNAGSSETQWVLDNIRGPLQGAEAVVVCVADEQSAKIARYLRGAARHVIVFSLLSPVFAEDMGWADALLFGYSYSPFTFNALFGALAGEFKPEGSMPLSAK